MALLHYPLLNLPFDAALHHPANHHHDHDHHYNRQQWVAQCGLPLQNGTFPHRKVFLVLSPSALLTGLLRHWISPLASQGF